VLQVNLLAAAARADGNPLIPRRGSVGAQRGVVWSES
jgi:histidine ammonia-lyase